MPYRGKGRGRRALPPVVPGKRCPAGRTVEQGVRDVVRHETYSEGVRDCSRCGRKAVKVTRSGGGFRADVPFSAWWYEPHIAPVKGADDDPR